MTMTTESIPWSRRILVRERPIWSFQNRVMIAMGKRVIWRKEKA
jgi:hypothetical protein